MRRGEVWAFFGGSACAGTQVGRLDDEDMVRLNQAMTVFLGMAVTPRAGRGKRS